MNFELYKQIPTWENGVWTYTQFHTLEDLRKYLIPLFKEPGKYKFNEISHEFNREARSWRQNKYYSLAPKGTKDYLTYWDSQKERCRKGAIFKEGKTTWYIPRDYYMWLNYLPIKDKEQGKYDFAQVRDAQYHLALYEILAEIHYRHSIILKKRQIASSYFHCAKLLNQIWFEEGPVLKIGASLKDYINEKGSWKFLNEYKDFLNRHTAWIRGMDPGKPMNWQQKDKLLVNRRWVESGLKGVIQGFSFESSATSGVGGETTYFFHEEAGIAPKMDETFEYLRPAMQSGAITTGMFIAAGSVGDLDQCNPLKEMVLNPEANDIYSVETDLLDDKGTRGVTSLFIPEQWSMPPCIDKYGNSKIAESLKIIEDLRSKWKKELTPEKYRLRISQHPTNIYEAFAYRNESKFSMHLIAAQEKRISEKEYPCEYLDMERDSDGKIDPRPSKRLPIKEFPIRKAEEDKRACLVVWERPLKDAPWGTYYGSIDPVGEGRTTTSESLCCIYIYKNPLEVTRIDSATKETKTHIERDKIVASWCGRYDDLTKTHEMLEKIIEWYNAWTIIENNISQFLQYMISRRKQKYLVTKDQILFLKDLGANTNVYQEYGWRNVGTLFKSHLLSYGVEYLKEELDHETSSTGEIMKTIYGVERIPDPMLLEEMKQYQDGLNVDRLVTYCALIAFAKVQQANRGYRKLTEYTSSKPSEKSVDLRKSTNLPFRHVGRNMPTTTSGRSVRKPFKNLR